MSFLYLLSQIFSVSPQFLKVNKESTFYLHGEIFISRTKLFTVHGKSRNFWLQNGMNSKCLPLEFHDRHKPSALSSEKSAPLNIPPTRSVDTTWKCICSLSSLCLESYNAPFQITEPLLQHHGKAQMTILHSFGFRSHTLTSFTLMAFLSFKITAKRPCLKALGFAMAFCIRTCLKHIFLKYRFSDCVWTFPFGPSKFAKGCLENIFLLGTKESAKNFNLLEAESWKWLRDYIFLHLIERGTLCPEN